jgi:hypothetical protein
MKTKLILLVVVIGIVGIGCGAIRTKVHWDVEDGRGTGWIQGPGSAKYKAVKPDGTTIDVAIERPVMWSGIVPQVINMGSEYRLAP